MNDLIPMSGENGEEWLKRLLENMRASSQMLAHDRRAERVHTGDLVRDAVTTLRICQQHPNHRVFVLGYLTTLGILPQSKRGRPHSFETCLGMHAYHSLQPRAQWQEIKNFGHCVAYCATLEGLPPENVWAFIESNGGLTRIAALKRKQDAALEDKTRTLGPQLWVPNCDVPDELVGRKGQFVMQENGVVAFRYIAAIN